jgi:probable rRNA maturation factor
VDPDSSRVVVTVTDGRGRRIADRGLARWLAALVPARLRGEVAIALVSDAQIRKLNREYRGKDAETDVLSFVADPDPERDIPRTPSPRTATRRTATPRTATPRPATPRFLGDIAIASGVARRQARAAGHPLQTELRVLALHGLLHLLGYDHDAPDDRGRMGRAEARLRRRGRLPAGLIARAVRSPRQRRGRA